MRQRYQGLVFKAGDGQIEGHETESGQYSDTQTEMTMKAPMIREAHAADTDAICMLLDSLGLVTEGVLLPGTRYWVAETEIGELIGVVGLEYGAEAVLLRSAAIHPDYQRLGIGTALVNTAYIGALQDNRPRVYCFSTDAQEYWAYRGFRRITVAEVLEALPDAPQVKLFDRLGWLPTEVAWRKDL